MFDQDEDKKPNQDKEIKIPGGYYNLATGCYEMPDTKDVIVWRDMERALGVLNPVNKQIH